MEDNGCDEMGFKLTEDTVEHIEKSLKNGESTEDIKDDEYPENEDDLSEDTIRNLKKAIELDPNSEDARIWKKKLRQART